MRKGSKRIEKVEFQADLSSKNMQKLAKTAKTGSSSPKLVAFVAKKVVSSPARTPNMLDRNQYCQYCSNRDVTTVTAEIYGFHQPK